MQGFPGDTDGQESACSVGDPGSIPRSGRPPEGNGNPLQYSYLENPMDRGAWQAPMRSQRVRHNWATSHTFKWGVRVLKRRGNRKYKQREMERQSNNDITRGLRNNAGFLNGSVGKESACNTGDIVDEGSIPGLGRSLAEEDGYPLQYFLPERLVWVKALAFLTWIITLTSWFLCHSLFWGFPGGASGKEPTCNNRRHKRLRFDPWVGKIPWRIKWQPTPVFLPGESQGQRRLACYSPGGRTEFSDWTTRNIKHLGGSTSSYFVACLLLPLGAHPLVTLESTLCSCTTENAPFRRRIPLLL